MRICPWCKEESLEWKKELEAYVCTNPRAADINAPCEAICGHCKYCDGLLIPQEFDFSGGACSWICIGCCREYPKKDRGWIDPKKLVFHPILKRKGKKKWGPLDSNLVGFVTSTSDDAHIIYGTGSCQIHKNESGGTKISESNETRFCVTSIAEKLKVLNVHWNPGFMIGVLMIGNETVVATSGSTGGPILRKWREELFEPNSILHILTWEVAELSVSLGGEKLPSTVLTAKEDFTGREAKCCAAPKIIEFARTKGFFSSDAKVYMSEMWYGEQPEGGSWRHGKPAPSCTGCQKVLPSLLCKTKG